MVVHRGQYFGPSALRWFARFFVMTPGLSQVANAKSIELTPIRSQ
jgi:hypothetical protein